MQKEAVDDLDSSSSSSCSESSLTTCEHKIHRDLIRTFVINGTKIKIKYKVDESYSIDIVRFRDIDNSKYLTELSMEEFEVIKDNFAYCMKEVDCEFYRVKSALEKTLNCVDMQSSFYESLQEVYTLLINIESDLKVFEKDAFEEIGSFKEKRDENNIFELIMLRKKLFVQLFNYVCILYKSKRMLKKICDFQMNLDNRDTQPRRAQKKDSKVEHSSSVSKTREYIEDQNKVNFEIVTKHKSMNEEFKSFGARLNAKKSIDDKSSDTQEKDVNDTSFLAERRPRKSSFEVIPEEKEDLIDSKINPHNEISSEVIVDVNSENNDGLQNSSKLISPRSNSQNHPNTEDYPEVNDKFSVMVDEQEEAKQVNELQDSLQGDESTFLNGD